MAAPKDYRQILIDLYRRHNPAKVGDVDFLLQKFEGREEEMIAMIKAKYPEPELPPEPAPAPSPPTPSAPATRSPRRWWIWLIPLVLGGGGFAAWWSGVFVAEVDREILFVVADTLYTHDHCDLGTESRLDYLPYGTPVEVWEKEAFCVETMIDTTRHYLPRKYLADEKEWLEIDGIYGNPHARRLFDDSYEKRALRAFLHDRGWSSFVPEDKRQLWGEKSWDAPVWQVFGISGEVPNVVANGYFGPDADREGTEDFAVILSRRLDPNRRVLVVFGFDEEQQARVLAELDLTEYPQYFIRKVTQQNLDELYRYPDDPLERLEKGQEGFLLEKADQKGKKYLLMVENGQIEVYSNRWGFFDLF